MKRKASAYNFPMEDFDKFGPLSAYPLGHAPRCAISRLTLLASFLLLIATSALAQQTQPPDDLTITTKDIPAAGLWDHYSARLDATGGIGPYSWHIVSGSLPRNLELRDFGLLEGVANEQGTFEIVVGATGHGGTRSKPKKLTLTVEPPLTAVWSRKTQVSGQQIDGSIKVSNTTGRDFDLTFIVLAVNDIGRATAIGYQHFFLKKNTRDMELPFGGTPGAGNYVVNVDVVGEEPVSNRIFRTRLIAPKQTIAPTL